jgi:hypothetical protein
VQLSGWLWLLRGGLGVDLGLLCQGTQATRDGRAGCQAVLLLDFLEQLFAQDGDVTWGADANSDLAAVGAQNDDLDLTANENRQRGDLGRARCTQGERRVCAVREDGVA